MQLIKNFLNVISYISPFLSFCRKGIPARSCRIQYLAKRRNTFSLGEKVPFRGDERWWKILIPDPHPPSKTVPTLPEGEGSMLYHGFCDSALRLRAEWQHCLRDQESNGYDGWVQSCSSGTDSSHLTLPACARQWIQGWGKCYRTFPITLCSELPDLLM